MLIEGVTTFFLIFVMFAIGLDEYGIPRPVAGFAGGLIVTVASFLGGPFTGGAMNPARALGPARRRQSLEQSRRLLDRPARRRRDRRLDRRLDLHGHAQRTRDACPITGPCFIWV